MNPLGLIVHGLCFLGVNVFAIECIRLFQLTLLVQSMKLKAGFHMIADRRSQYGLRSSAIIWKHFCDPAIVIADDRRR